jgi:3-oxoacyl-(acyl-carrier-protein) synthase/NAD(P)-dependent dehydrogenase (short-subunit alcohol dehydrogenase family)/acyl carrier protein
MNATPRDKSEDWKREALLGLQRARKKIQELEAAANEPVAIVGMGCRFPGSGEGADAFWEFLCRGGNAVGEVPRDRWTVDDFYDAGHGVPGRLYSRDGAFLDGIRGFDASFFGISAVEAMRMDPQQRLLLEVAWQALENAGECWERHHGGKAGVFVGATMNDYGQLLLQAKDWNLIDTYFCTGNPLNALAGRIAYFLGATGPAVVVDSACSASLVSVHLACQSLRGRECDLALVGGVNVLLSPEPSIALCQAQMLARDGRCKTFDARADGFVRGEGCGVLVLKRLQNALAEGNLIHAVIRGSAINHNGPSGGFVVPNGRMQEAVMRDALERGGVRAAEVGFLEAHGTGTALGDPIELGAIASVYGDPQSRVEPLRVGSVKTNIGHLEAAAGIAGLIKTVLCLKNRRVPGNLHFEEPNPRFAWNQAAMRVPVASESWDAPPGGALVAACSSFGASGTNAHIVVQSPPEELSREQTAGTYLYPLSARSELALQSSTVRFADWLGRSLRPLLDVSHTLLTGRQEMPFRRSFVARSRDELAMRLSAGEHEPLRVVPPEPVPSVFVLGHWAASGRVGDEEFLAHVDSCARILSEEIGLAIGDVENVADFARQYAAVRLLLDRGVRPDAFTGYGVGEYVAAVFSGVLSLRVAIRMLARGGESDGDAECTAARPQVPFFSICRRDWVDKELDRQHWRRALYGALDLDATVGIFLDQPRVFVEMDSDRLLSAAVAAHPCGSVARGVISSIPGSATEALDIVARLWESGAAVDLRAVDQCQGGGRLVELPGYAFDREDHWFSPAESEPRGRDEGTFGPILYEPAWQVGELSARVSAEPARGMVFVEREGDWERMSELAAREIGVAIRRVDIGDRRSAEVLAEVSATNPDWMVFFPWRAGDAEFGVESLEEFLDFLKTLAAANVSRVRVLVVARGACGPDRYDDAILPMAATLATVVAQENPGIEIAIADLGGRDVPEEVAAARLVSEARGFRPGRRVAYFSGLRCVLDYRRLEESGAGNVFRQGGVYLVTGGLGRIGRWLATHLLKRYGATVVLVTRSRVEGQKSPVVGREDWGRVFSGERRLFLEKMSGEKRLTVMSGCVEELGDLRRVFDEIVSRFGTVNGIFHAAGLAQGETVRTVADTPWEEVRRHCRSKMDGAINLLELCCEKHLDLDFVVLMSSISSILGGLGHGAYGAANAFSAALAARAQRAHEARWWSIEWDTWDLDLEHVPAVALAPREAMDVLECVLGSSDGGSQVIVSAGPLEERLRQWLRKASPASSSVVVRSVETDRASIERAVTSLCAELLETEDVSLEDSFFDLGGDSLVATKFVSSLRDRLGVSLSLPVLFSSQRVGDLVDAVEILVLSASGSATVMASQEVTEIEI